MWIALTTGNNDIINTNFTEITFDKEDWGGVNVSTRQDIWISQQVDVPWMDRDDLANTTPTILYLCVSILRQFCFRYKSHCSKSKTVHLSMVNTLVVCTMTAISWCCRVSTHQFLNVGALSCSTIPPSITHMVIFPLFEAVIPTERLEDGYSFGFRRVTLEPVDGTCHTTTYVIDLD